MDGMTPWKWIDLFSGIGGFALGMRMAGFPPPISFCEIEPFCRKVLAKHWPEVPCHEDIKKFSAVDLRGIDLVAGGFPCQDVSCAGKGKGVEHGERSGLWREMFRIIQECMPRWVLAENVPALRTRGADLVIADLEAAGYSVWPIVVGAWSVGAPHKRDRVWIVAKLSNTKCNGFGSGNCQPEGQQPGPGWEPRGFASPSGEHLADPIEDGRRSGAGTAGSKGCQRFGRDGVAGSGDVADGNEERLFECRVSEGQERGGFPDSTGRRTCGARSLALTTSERCQESGRIERGAFPATSAPSWPAGRGAEQFPWEAPRVLRFERGVGSSIDGVPVRLVRRHNRDVLRGAGNAVVPQVVAAIVARMKEIDENA